MVKSLWKPSLLVLAVMAAVSASALPAQAAETSNSEIVIIREGEVVSDDLYVGAIRVVVEGRIDGDLIAFAAEDVVINGTVTGSVFAVTQRLSVSGTVEGPLRVVAGSISVSGTVGDDVVAVGLDSQLGPESTAGGEVLAWSWSLRSLGDIGALRGSQRNLELGGSVDSDVDVSVGRLRIVEPLSVGGDLGFRSENEAEGLDQATVGGVVVDKAPLPPNIRARALILFAKFLVVLFLTVASLTVVWGWPVGTRAAIQAVRVAPVRSWGVGALVVFSPLLILGVALLVVALAPAAASFPLLAIFAPLTLAAIGVVGAVALVAGVPAVGWLGSRLLPRRSVHAAVLAGSVITGLLWLLPVLAWLVPLVVLPLGLGAWSQAWNVDSEASEA